MKIEHDILLGEAYSSYFNSTKDLTLETLQVPYTQTHLYGTVMGSSKFRPYAKVEFINLIGTSEEFQSKWNVIIEERYMTNQERSDYKKKRDNISYTFAPYTDQMLDNANIPTQIVTLTFKDKIAVIYG